MISNVCGRYSPGNRRMRPISNTTNVKSMICYNLSCLSTTFVRKKARAIHLKHVKNAKTMSCYDLNCYWLIFVRKHAPAAHLKNRKNVECMIFCAFW